jgi:gliding motility-associated-like protein
MMQKKNNTYTSFKDAFREFEEQPRTEVWENIETSMLKLRKAKMKRNIVVGSSLALAVAALSFFMINNAMETSNDSISNKMSNYNYNDKNIVSNSIVTEKELDGVFDEAINEELRGATTGVKEVSTFVAENKIAKEVVLNNVSEKTSDEYMEQTIADISNTSSSKQESANPITANEKGMVENKKQSTEVNESIHPAVATDDSKEAERNITVSNKSRDGENKESVLEENVESQSGEIFKEESLKAVLHVPTAFTPDESENNRFYVKGVNIKKYEIHIFSKTRTLVYSSTDINGSWDGTYNGEMMEMGVYVFMIMYTDMNNESHQKNGTIMLLRRK